MNIVNLCTNHINNIQSNFRNILDANVYNKIVDTMNKVEYILKLKTCDNNDSELKFCIYCLKDNNNMLDCGHIYCTSCIDKLICKEQTYNCLLCLKNFSINLFKHKFISKELKYELIEKCSIPPNISSLLVFKKGGVLYWESWDEINIMNSD